MLGSRGILTNSKRDFTERGHSLSTATLSGARATLRHRPPSAATRRSRPERLLLGDLLVDLGRLLGLEHALGERVVEVGLGVLGRLTFSAGEISEIRLTRARSYIVRSAADSDASRLRAARFRTTSATWYTSPLFSFSWWFLNRRLQLDGTRGSGLASTDTRSSSSSALTGGRTPTSSALSTGTFSIISLMTVSRIRYSCFSPNASIFLVPLTTHAPCWG